MLKGPAFRFKIGRVVEIEHESGRFGYLIGRFHKPRYGGFFTLITRTYDVAVPKELIGQILGAPSRTVWLNTYKLLSTTGSITFRHKCDLKGYSAPEPSRRAVRLLGNFATSRGPVKELPLRFGILTEPKKGAKGRILYANGRT
jgi:hypothetical protein